MYQADNGPIASVEQSGDLNSVLTSKTLNVAKQLFPSLPIRDL
jgi:hypothetical protein